MTLTKCHDWCHAMMYCWFTGGFDISCWKIQCVIFIYVAILFKSAFASGFDSLLKYISPGNIQSGWQVSYNKFHLNLLRRRATRHFWVGGEASWKLDLFRAGWIHFFFYKKYPWGKLKCWYLKIEYVENETNKKIR